jgi:outer membrane protein TolC
MPRHRLSGAPSPLVVGIHQPADSDTAQFDMAQAKTEIERLRRELALAREELENLTDATSDFVKLML